MNTSLIADKQHIAVIGTGYWGKNLARNFFSIGALHTICDLNEDLFQMLATQYAGVTFTRSYQSVLADRAITAVAIATPAETHADMVRQALLAGKDVFVEKPLCLAEVDAKIMVALAREQQRILMVGHLLWYHPAVLKLHEIIGAGELGRIQYIYSNRLNLGKLRREENVLWSFAPHDISVILGLTGEIPEVVTAQGGNYLHKQIADTTVTLLEFASGIKAHIFVSWLHPFKEQKLVVVGEKKMAVFDDTLPWQDKLQLYAHTIDWHNNAPVAHKAVAQRVEVIEEEPLRAECAHFLSCIQTRTRPKTDGEEGLRVLQVLNGCQQSLNTETKVRLTQALEHPSAKDYFIHPTAVVDNEVQIGSGSKIWHFSHLMDNCRVGAKCNLGQNVVIGSGVILGNNCKVQNNVSIYEGVSLEDNVFCGPSMVFTNVINPRCEFIRKDQYKPTLIKKGATLGANCCIICGVTVGSYAFIGAGAVVTGDVPDFALMVGSPARQIGWMSRFGERMDFGSTTQGKWTCGHTGECYLLDGAQCSLLPPSD